MGDFERAGVSFSKPTKDLKKALLTREPYRLVRSFTTCPVKLKCNGFMSTKWHWIKVVKADIY